MNFDVKVTDADGNECTQEISIPIAAAGIDWTQLSWNPITFTVPTAVANVTPLLGVKSDTCNISWFVSDVTGDVITARNIGTMTYNGGAVNCKVTITITNLVGSGSYLAVIVTYNGSTILSKLKFPLGDIVYVEPFTITDTGGLIAPIEVDCKIYTDEDSAVQYGFNMACKFENV